MSTYTTEVRFICESLAGYDESQGFKKVDEIVKLAAPQIFENFPIFDENHRLELECKILKHYYTREISAETPGLWMLWLNNRLNEIMPYYNQLYYLGSLEYNPFEDVDLVRTHAGTDSKNINGSQDLNQTNSLNSQNVQDQHTLEKGNTDTISQSSSTSDGTSHVISKDSHDFDTLRKYSDTPQGSISGQPLFENYLTRAENEDGVEHTNGDAETTSTTDTKGSSTYNTNSSKTVEISGTSNTNQNGTTINKQTSTQSEAGQDEFTETVKGKQGTQSYSLMKLQYKQTIDNVDLLIINELGDLFFNLY